MERNASRSIREHQDAAYQLSLKADREKAERIKQEKAALKLEEEKKKKELERIETMRMEKIKRKHDLAANLAPEPELSVKDKSTINIRLPNGSRLIRKFHSSAKIQVNE